MQPVERRLAAIMALDVVGYSRMMGDDETGTLDRLKQVQTRVLTRQIDQFHGRVVKLMGDGMLIEFGSVVNAVSCAIAIQTEMQQWNRDNIPMQLRIGINSGDIIIDGNDIFGDGVNIAARLESIADVGGVFVSAAVHASVHNKVTATFEYVGEKQLKNIETPVAVYRVHFDGITNITTNQSASTAPLRRILPATTVVLLLAVVIYWLFVHNADTQQPVAQSTPPQPPNIITQVPQQQKPLIAVLPFNNFSPDKNQDYFSDGLTEDLITDISKIGSIGVIARNSTFAYKGTSPDVRQIGTTLGATHVVEGSVRKAGNTVRITVQLINAIDGSHIWAERYDRQLQEIFTLQDEITSKIISAIAQQLGTTKLPTQLQQAQDAALQYAADRRPAANNVAAYEEFLQGWALYNRPSPENFVEAVTHFQHALELDPDYIRANEALASVYWEVWKRFWQRSLGLSQNYLAWEKADQYLQKTVQTPSPLSYRVSSEMLLFNRRYGQAITEAEAAIRLDPNSALSYVVLANAKTFAGEAADAIPLIEKAMQLDPHYPPAYLFNLALAQFCLEQYRDAANHLTKAIERNAGDPFWFALLLAIYGKMGELDNAQQALTRLDALQSAANMPRFSIGWPTGRWPFKENSDTVRLKEGFLAGGLPEG